MASVLAGEQELSLNLQLMRLLLDALGNPQRSLQIAHVAGSKGKATTAAHVANIMTSAGVRSGRFLSPHLNSWCERIAIDGGMISEAEFAAVAERTLDAARTVELQRPDLGPVNAFQLVLAMALTHFTSRSCEFAAIEVGLGGRYDPTNVLEPAVSVVTQLEIEHAEILGQSIERIAWNKAGIFKPGVPAVALRSDEMSASVLEDVARDAGAPLLLEKRDWTWSAGADGVAVTCGTWHVGGIVPAMPGDHQEHMAALAAVVSQQLQGHGLWLEEAAIRQGVSRTTLIGHFEVVDAHGCRFVLDVAHTPGSVEALVRALASAGIDSYRVVAGFLSDKEIAPIAGTLAASASDMVLVPVRSPRSASSEQLAAAAAHSGARVRLHSQLDEVLFPADSQHCASEWTVVTGSNALVAETRERLGVVDRSRDISNAP